MFDAEGRLHGEVQIPEGLTLYQIGDESVHGRVTDDVGIERVVLYDLINGDTQ